jgi:hypothetical protein
MLTTLVCGKGCCCHPIPGLTDLEGVQSEGEGGGVGEVGGGGPIVIGIDPRLNAQGQPGGAARSNLGIRIKNVIQRDMRCDQMTG